MSSLIKSYRDLIVWQKSIELAVDLYALTRRFPASERFGMTSQIQRAGVSIPSNIAEGHDKHGRGNYLNHLGHSRGSLAEIETMLIISGRVGYLNAETQRDLAFRTDEIGRMLRGLTSSIANRSDDAAC